MSYWWLSFADPRTGRFLGVCIVAAPPPGETMDVTRESLAHAIRRSHALGINPGGEVQASWLGPESGTGLKPGWTDRLLTREDCAEFDRVHT